MKMARKKTIKGRAQDEDLGAINPAAAAAPQNTSVVPVAYSCFVRAERSDFHLSLVLRPTLFSTRPILSTRSAAINASQKLSAFLLQQAFLIKCS
jgi:hypothetical protein